MASKSYIVVSGLVDATVKEYQPDVDFKIFHTLEGLGNYLDTSPIRAEILFFTKDVVGGANTSFSYLKSLVLENDYLVVDRVIYITENDSEELISLRYLIDEFHLDNWEVIQGTLHRSFVQEVINGTFREDTFSAKRKVVIRKPRAEYVKQQLKEKTSLSEEYVDDDNDLSDIPDVDIPHAIVEVREESLKKVFIAGNVTRIRTAFTLLAAQYLSLNNKVLVVESDPEYHTMTEFVTKAGIDADVVTITDIYEDINRALSILRSCKKNLVIVECIDRIKFDYDFVTTLLYYNLLCDYNYMMFELPIDKIPHNTNVTITMPSTITGVLATGELIDKSLVDYCTFVAVDLNDLPETQVDSGLVISNILNDVISVQSIDCPVLKVSSLKLKGTFYDLGNVLGGIDL